MSTLSLFPEARPELAERLTPKLRRLAGEGIYFGTSSWKYEGWMGQIYSRERYLARGRFSRKKFEAECLAEYAETFPVVCGDFSFYQFPARAFWEKLFSTAPANLLFAFKVPEEITVKRFPRHDRYGDRAGLDNDSFLNAELFERAFLAELAPWRDRIAVLIFEFGAFSRKSFEDAAPFVEQLDAFLSRLPGGFRYSVEVRNPDLLDADYFGSLRMRNVAHVFNAWTRMPELPIQMALSEAYTTDFTVVRALLRHGRSYEQAVAKFSPYAHIQEPNPAAREAIRDLVIRSRNQRRTAFIFVNNRLEGNAPQSIAAMMED